MAIGAFIAELIGGIITDKAKNGLNLKDKKKLYDRSKSIVEKAKRGIMRYTTLYTSKLANDNPELIYKVNRYCEIQYAVFTLISLGLDPTIAEGDEVIDKISYYSGESLNFKEDNVVTLSVEDVSEETKNAFIEAMKDRDALEVYEPTVVRGVDHSEEGLSDYRAMKNKKRRKGNNTKEDDNGVKVSADKNRSFYTTLETKIGKSAPILLKIKLYLNTGDAIEIPIGVKCLPRIMMEEEVIMMFKYVNEDSKPLHRLVQLSTGEIKFIKDFVLQMEKIEENAELYQRIGRHPWYMQLTQRRRESLISKILRQVFPDIFRGVILPTCTIVCTKDELVESLNMRYGSLIKKRKLSFLQNQMMLLGLMVYDTETGLFEHHLTGLDESFVVTDKDLSDSKGDEISEVMKAMRELMRKI